jgi:hypothetical protein
VAFGVRNGDGIVMYKRELRNRSGEVTIDLDVNEKVAMLPDWGIK